MSRGRPRKIDPDLALEKAMNVFWEKGFDGASMSDLVTATGMAKPGLYANFGDKEALFKRALEHYFNDAGGPMLRKFQNSTGPIKSELRILFSDTAESLLNQDNPAGCFVVNSLIDCASKSEFLRKFSQEIDEKRRNVFLDRFEQAHASGEFPDGVNIQSLANYYASQVLAMAVMARAKVGRHMIEEFIEMALNLLPENTD